MFTTRNLNNHFNSDGFYQSPSYSTSSPSTSMMPNLPTSHHRGGIASHQSTSLHGQHYIPTQVPSYYQGNLTSISPAPYQSANVQSQPRRPNEVFVGDLSFFCREQDLIDHFSQYGRVTNCHVVLNDNRTRSLMFGFVTMSTEPEAVTVASKVHNQLFMGRTIKVELLKEYRTLQALRGTKVPTYLKGHQIHVTFASSFPPDRVVVPNEVFLRKFFCRYGVINDVIIREYTVHQNCYKQDGFGFVTFATEEAASLAAFDCHDIQLEGIYLKCKLSVVPPNKQGGGGMKNKFPGRGGNQFGAPQFGGMSYPSQNSGYQNDVELEYMNRLAMQQATNASQLGRPGYHGAMDVPNTVFASAQLQQQRFAARSNVPSISSRETLTSEPYGSLSSLPTYASDIKRMHMSQFSMEPTTPTTDLSVTDDERLDSTSHSGSTYPRSFLDHQYQDSLYDDDSTLGPLYHQPRHMSDSGISLQDSTPSYPNSFPRAAPAQNSSSHLNKIHSFNHSYSSDSNISTASSSTANTLTNSSSSGIINVTTAQNMSYGQLSHNIGGVSAQLSRSLSQQGREISIASSQFLDSGMHFQGFN